MISKEDYQIHKELRDGLQYANDMYVAARGDKDNKGIIKDLVKENKKLIKALDRYLNQYDNKL